jgi:hypothetical protein
MSINNKYHRYSEQAVNLTRHAKIENIPSSSQERCLSYTATVGLSKDVDITQHRLQAKYRERVEASEAADLSVLSRPSSRLRKQGHPSFYDAGFEETQSPEFVIPADKVKLQAVPVMRSQESDMNGMAGVAHSSLLC